MKSNQSLRSLQVCDECMAEEGSKTLINILSFSWTQGFTQHLQRENRDTQMYYLLILCSLAYTHTYMCMAHTHISIYNEQQCMWKYAKLWTTVDFSGKNQKDISMAHENLTPLQFPAMQAAPKQVVP